MNYHDEDEGTPCDYCGIESYSLNRFHDGSEICDTCLQYENYDDPE